MFLNSSVPAAVVIFGGIMVQHHFHARIINYCFASISGAATFMGFLYCGYLCEKRRWTQTFSAARQLRFNWRGRE
jgi:hypothetical protein